MLGIQSSQCHTFFEHSYKCGVVSKDLIGLLDKGLTLNLLHTGVH